MALKAPLRVMEIDLAAPLEPLAWQPDENGAHVLVRHGMDLVGRIWLERSAHPDGLTAEALEALARQKLGVELTRRLLYRELIAGLDLGPPPPPSLTITVCTRNRPAMLRRCIESIRATCAQHPELATNVEILIVDNAPPDDATRDVVAEFPDVRYVREPVPGLDFARNRAIAECSKAYIAYIDDDAIADRYWLCGFAEAAQHYPGAACITGAVLPAALETPAQVYCEMSTSFLKGFERIRYVTDRWGDWLYPCNSVQMGMGANMSFRVGILEACGGFDEALDTGPPLGGGGDLDIFYRLIRMNKLIVYEPGLMVAHEHRREIQALRKQYFNWGLGGMAYFRKHIAQDPNMAKQMRGVIWWHILQWFPAEIVRALDRKKSGRNVLLILAEFCGFVKGYFGEYERSKRRVEQRIRDASV